MRFSLAVMGSSCFGSETRSKVGGYNMCINKLLYFDWWALCWYANEPSMPLEFELPQRSRRNDSPV